MSIERNKAIAMDWVRFTIAGEIEKARALFSPDCRFLIAGDMPFCGWMGIDAFYANASTLPLAGPITMEIGEMTADGEYVWLEAQSDAPLVSGERYQNWYVFRLRVQDGLITEYKEYCDTLYTNRVLYNGRDEPQPRYPIFDEATASFTGNAVAETMKD